jgi:hypothetical protein
VRIKCLRTESLLALLYATHPQALLPSFLKCACEGAAFGSSRSSICTAVALELTGCSLGVFGVHNIFFLSNFDLLGHKMIWPGYTFALEVVARGLHQVKLALRF